MNEGLSFNSPKDRIIADIKSIQGEVASMGANDYEIPALNRLIEEIKKGDITPEEALMEANKIKSSKQDYH